MINIDTISMGMNIHKSQLYIDVNQKGVQADLTHPQMGVFRNGDTQKLMVDDGHPIKVDWLVVDLPLWKICSSVGMIIPNYWGKKNPCSKPPTRWLGGTPISGKLHTCAVDPCVAAYGKAMISVSRWIKHWERDIHGFIAQNAYLTSMFLGL